MSKGPQLIQESLIESDIPKICDQFLYETHTFSDRICHHCAKPMGNSTYLKLRNSETYFHPDHLFCSICKSQIGETGFFPVEDNLFCTKCYSGKHTSPCPICSQPILENHVIMEGKTFHKSCLRCKICKKRLKEKCFDDPEEDANTASIFSQTSANVISVWISPKLCEDCFTGKNRVCLVCRKGVPGKGLQIEENIFSHFECFNCERCDKYLRDSEFKIEGNTLRCQDCEV